MTHTRQTAGKLGGLKTKERHGREFFQRIGGKGGRTPRSAKPLVAAAYRFANGMVMVFDFVGQQIPDLQDSYSEKLERRIRARSTDRTQFHGFPPDAPRQWR